MIFYNSLCYLHSNLKICFVLQKSGGFPPPFPFTAMYKADTMKTDTRKATINVSMFFSYHELKRGSLSLRNDFLLFNDASM